MDSLREYIACNWSGKGILWKHGDVACGFSCYCYFGSSLSRFGDSSGALWYRRDILISNWEEWAVEEWFIFELMGLCYWYNGLE